MKGLFQPAPEARQKVARGKRLFRVAPELVLQKQPRPGRAQQHHQIWQSWDSVNLSLGWRGSLALSGRSY